VTRGQERRDQEVGIRTREVRAENISMQGRKMHDALTCGEKEQVSEHESSRSEGIRAGESWIRRPQKTKEVHQMQSGWTGCRGPYLDGVSKAYPNKHKITRQGRIDVASRLAISIPVSAASDAQNAQNLRYYLC